VSRTNEDRAAEKSAEVVGPRSPWPRAGRYLVTGGGTGGHVYPAIAIADEVRRRDPEARILYVGVRGRAEERIVPRRGYPIRFVSSEGWPGTRRPLALVRFLAKLTAGFVKSLFILLSFRPKVVIGTGGYVSAPIMLAAIVLRKFGLFSGRTFIHEQNTFPGKLNRLIGALVDRVGVSFPESLKYFPRTGTWVGYPVRRELGRGGDPDAVRERLGIPPGKKVVFVFGGSQGARTINRAIVEALPRLKERGDIFVIHGTGTYRGKDYDATADTEQRLEALNLDGPQSGCYLRRAYFHDIEDIYTVADLVVCRAGAGTLTELAARGLPAIILPKANLPGDHQVKNARALAAAGAGVVLYERVVLTERGIEEHVPGADLAKAILELLDDPVRLAEMGEAARRYHRSDALDRIVAVLGALCVPGHEPPALPPPPEPPAESGPDLTAMGAVALIRYLRARKARGDGPLDPADMAYLRYRTDDYLASRRWQVRNHGVKLVGLLGYRERIPHLLYLLEERRSVGPLLRLLGGDYEQVGFIRRNVFDALVEVDVADEQTVKAIEIGLEDRYFEARSHAAAAAEHFASRLGSARSRIQSRLETLLADSSFEVVCAVVRALGRVSDDPDILRSFQRFRYSKYWRVRMSVAVAVRTLLERGVVTPDGAERFMEEVLITSDGFLPHFPLKAELKRLGETIAGARGEGKVVSRPEDAA